MKTLEDRIKEEISGKWEMLDWTISRLKVPGGWLVLTTKRSICFYPDKDHEWLKEPHYQHEER